MTLVEDFFYSCFSAFHINVDFFTCNNATCVLAQVATEASSKKKKKNKQTRLTQVEIPIRLKGCSKVNFECGSKLERDKRK